MSEDKVLYVCGEDCGYTETAQEAADREYAIECPVCGGPIMGAG